MTAICLAACGVLLAGCRVQGSVDVVSRDQLAVDLLLVGDEAPCDVAFQSPRLAYTRTTDSTGAPACRVTGTLDTQYLRAFELTITDVGEYRIFRTDETSRRRSWPDGALEIRFPGDVQTTSLGTISGHTVRINDLPSLSDGIEVVALSRPGPPDRLLWGGIGLAGGLAVALLGLGLARRSARARRVEPDEPELVPAVPLTGTDADTGEDHTDWASPPEDGLADPDRSRGTGRPTPSSGFSPPDDHSFWAPPAADAGPGERPLGTDR